MEDYFTDAFVLVFLRFSCRFAYPQYLLHEMSYSFVDTKRRLFGEFCADYRPRPVDAHYKHGNVERKLREVNKCVHISTDNERLSIVQRETLMYQLHSFFFIRNSL